MRKVKRVLLFLIITLLVSCLSPVVAEENNKSESNRQTFTIALPYKEGNNENLTENDIGYTYDYLLKLAQLYPVDFDIKWYQINDEEIYKILDSVKTGTIDFVGGFSKGTSLDNDYLFSKHSYGNSNLSIIADIDNNDINERSIYVKKNIRVGLSDSNKNGNEALIEFLNENNIDNKIIYYKTYGETVSAVKHGEVDIIVGKDTGLMDGLKEIIELDKTPFYFITSKNNAKKMNVLDDAMLQMNIVYPNLIATLHNKYYGNEMVGTALVDSELEFIQTMQPLKVGVITNNEPLQSYDKKSGEFHGILIDVMNELAKNTNLRIEYVLLDQKIDVKEAFQENSIDLILGVPMNYNVAYENGYLLTSALLQLPVVRVMNIYGQTTGDVVSSAYLYLDDSYKKINFDNEIMANISKGKIREAYMDGYRANYLARYYKSIDIAPSTYSDYEVSIAVNRNEDSRVMTILEQGIRSISEQKIADIVYDNTLTDSRMSFIDYIQRDPTLMIYIISIFSVLIVSILLLFLYKTNQMKKIIADERKHFAILAQYDQLTGVLNQQTFKSIVQKGMVESKEGVLISIDLDDFKKINDVYGHLEGDNILTMVGKLLINNFTQYVVGRMGGDEFMVYINRHVDETRIKQITEKFIEEMKLKNEPRTVTVSVGILFFEGVSDFDDIYYHVDELLYDVKREGRNGIKTKRIDSEILRNYKESKSKA